MSSKAASDEKRPRDGNRSGVTKRGGQGLVTPVQ